MTGAYSDDDVAGLYDILNPWGPGDDFYLSLAVEAPSVLDIGCGTGTLLRRARERGHTGRLCGIDPDRAALAVARRRTDVEWIEGTAAAMPFDCEFDLAIMAGHAFQSLVADEDLRASLAAIRQALVLGGRFAFETRNPRARAWEDWHPGNAVDVLDPSGRSVRISHEVESVIDDVVTLIETTSDPDGSPLRVDRGSLRFLDPAALTRRLTEAGLEIDRQYGGWHREPLRRDSREIVTIARAPA